MSFYGDGTGKLLSRIAVPGHPQHHPDTQKLVSAESSERVGRNI